MSDVEVKKPVLPVSGLFGDLSAGGDLTTVQVLNNLMSSGVNLALVTEIPEPVGFSVICVVSGFARSRKLVRTADRVDAFVKAYRENMVSFKRQGRREIIEGVVADMERSRREGEGISERMIGGGRGSR